MLIANPDDDLYDVFQDAGLVGEAALRCELCKDEARVVELFDKTATEIRAALEELAEKLEFNDKVFVWYSGHGLSDEGGSTLLLTKKAEPSDGCDAVEGVEGLWLEDTVYEIFEPKRLLTLTIWCVDASCRERAEEVCQKEDLLPQPDSGNTYAFMYACCIGKVMLDSSIFATGFCYTLERQPGDLATVKNFLQTECEIITFGDLKPPPIKVVGVTDSVELETQPPRPRSLPAYNRVWIGAIRRARLVADHLHYLADEALTPKHGSCSSASDSGPYGSYVKVRAMASEIIKNFYLQKDQFEELHQQLRLLRCNSLAEVQAELSASSSSSASDELAQWNPCGNNEWTLDMRVLQNLPKEVIHEIGEAHRTWKEKWKEENETDYPTDPIFEMLRMLGCFYTERNFPGAAPIGMDGIRKVRQHMENYFKVIYIPGASFAHDMFGRLVRLLVLVCLNSFSFGHAMPQKECISTRMRRILTKLRMSSRRAVIL